MHCEWAGCVLRRGPGCRLVQSGGEEEAGLMIGRGSCSCGLCQHVAPVEKNCLWPPPTVSPLRRRAGRDPERRLLVCMQRVCDNYKPLSLRKKMCSFFVNLGHHDIWFLVTYLFWFHLLPISTSTCADFVFASLILLPDYFGSNTQNGGRELENWKAESGSHFLTDPGSGTEKVKNF